MEDGTAPGSKLLAPRVRRERGSVPRLPVAQSAALQPTVVTSAIDKTPITPFGLDFRPGGRGAASNLIDPTQDARPLPHTASLSSALRANL